MRRGEDTKASLAAAQAREATLVQEKATLEANLKQATEIPAPAATPTDDFGGGQQLAVQNLQNQLHEKDKALENLKSTLDESTKLKDSEIKLVSTAFYEIGLELQQRWRAPPQPRSWLGAHRKRLQSERAPAG